MCTAKRVFFNHILIEKDCIVQRNQIYLYITKNNLFDFISIDMYVLQAELVFKLL